MNLNAKIGALKPEQRQKLVNLMEINEGWRQLLVVIPKHLNREFECEISPSNPPAFKDKYIRVFEQNSTITGRLCSEILLFEWSLLGRVRPSLGHVLHLLTKAELFMAADYLANEVLNIERPQRPVSGPAASIPADDMLKRAIRRDVEKALDHISYPPSDLLNGCSQKTINDNLDYPKIDDKSANLQHKVVWQQPERLLNSSQDLLPVFVNKLEGGVQNSISDMIEFSKTASQAAQESSNSCNDTISLDEESEIYLQSLLRRSGTNSFNPSSIDKQDAVALNQLLSKYCIDSSSLELPNLSELKLTSHAENNQNDVPIASKFSGNKQKDVESSLNVLPSVMERIYTSEFFLPATVQSENEESLKISNNSPSRLVCVSPLPINLQLDTSLPHFSYRELLLTTNSFDQKPYDKNESNLLKAGRLLGTGAFGSVYLAIDLLPDKWVAVKKLFLKEDTQEVSLDDAITIQFKNEVEALSKYHHKNLVSLVGYSCDGSTYCLVYDYIAGGSLKDRLQQHLDAAIDKDALSWTNRMEIALGTARAIAYLHTAEKTPLIHRDVKSANILLDLKKKPKLCDLGVSRVIPSNVTSSFTSSYGTNAYMPTEAFSGQVSVKLDTFSFGVVLLELITGLPPLDEKRKGCDLISHVDEVCEDDSIAPLVDKKAGCWIIGDVNYAEELYKIAVQCYEHKRNKRPTMVEVTEKLTALSMFV